MRLLTLTVLYILARRTFDAAMSFWAVLIVLILPKLAAFGSDALSDWPALCFLTLGVLLLVMALSQNRPWLYACAGLVAGLGYLVRPECAILVLIGALWLIIHLIEGQYMTRWAGFKSLILLFTGFLILAGPYMHLKNAVFPKKSLDLAMRQEPFSDMDVSGTQARLCSNFGIPNVGKALGKLAQNIGETLMWLFLPAMFIGMAHWFRGRTWREPAVFVFSTLSWLYTVLMIWLYCRHGYMSERHTLPLLIVPILYVPIGFVIIAQFCQKRLITTASSFNRVSGDQKFWLVTFMVVGTAVCTPKLLRPLRIEKRGYRAAAKWLRENTEPTATIAVPDDRIGFYSGRQTLTYESEHSIPETDYIVVANKKCESREVSSNLARSIEYQYASNTKRGIDVTVYKRP